MTTTVCTGDDHLHRAHQIKKKIYKKFGFPNKSQKNFFFLIAKSDFFLKNTHYAQKKKFKNQKNYGIEERKILKSRTYKKKKHNCAVNEDTQTKLFDDGHRTDVHARAPFQRLRRAISRRLHGRAARPVAGTRRRTRGATKRRASVAPRLGPTKRNNNIIIIFIFYCYFYCYDRCYVIVIISIAVG